MQDEHDPKAGTSAGDAAWAWAGEEHRRAGRLDEAQRVIEDGLARDPDNLPGRVALALVHFERGRLDEAQRQLVASLDRLRPSSSAGEAVDFGDSLGEAELERAFAVAETDPEEMLSSDTAAEAALASAGVEGIEAAGFDPASQPVFATETMAGLLEQQGDAPGARAIRDSIRDTAAEVPAAPPHVDAAVEAAGGPPQEALLAQQARILMTLESWLSNLRGRRNELRQHSS
ncbi:MAG: tetratricopeptide repeat protein [Proteobacteria bacterium]|nr:tetratricopeptide repeat protein [Pseudomonadota bacterium]